MKFSALVATVVTAAALSLPSTASATQSKSWYAAFPTNFQMQGTIVQDGATYSIDASAPWLEWVSYEAAATGATSTSYGPVSGTWSASLPNVCSQSGMLDPAQDTAGVSWGGTDGWYSTFHVTNGAKTDGTYSCLGPTQLMNSVALGSCPSATYPHSVMLQPTFVIEENCTPTEPATGSIHHHVEFAIRKVNENNEPIEGGAPITKFLTPATKKITTRPRTIRAQIRATRAGNVRVDMKFGSMALTSQTFNVTAATKSLNVRLPNALVLRAAFGSRTSLPVTLFVHGGSVGLRRAVVLKK